MTFALSRGSHGERAVGLLERGVEGAKVVGGEGPGREALLDGTSACRRVDSIRLGDRGLEVAVLVDDDPGATVLEDLRHGAAPGGDDRSAARQRLDHDQAEGLLPVDGEEGGLQALALALLQHETLDAPDAYAAAGLIDASAPTSVR